MRKQKMTSRELRQWFFTPLFILVIALGWKYPYLGYMAPVTMAAGFAVSFFKGRYICGNYCPRGAFFDRLMSRLTLSRPIPKFLKKKSFRYGVVVFMLSLMTYKIAINPFDAKYIGLVFWQMCFATSLLGVTLAVLYKPRTWCSFCPMGTIEAAIGGNKQPIVSQKGVCKSCGLCEKRCPMELEIVNKVEDGTIANPDCIKCGECIGSCPIKTLRRK
ncbi:MAG: 4Fe-4S binding protein [Alphaproteobacteria bacterium]